VAEEHSRLSAGSLTRAAGTREAGGVLGQQQTVGGLVVELMHRLGGLEDAEHEARDLLAALLDVPRHWPLLKENKWVEHDVWMRACAAADKRAAGAPVAYAVGRASFRNLVLAVDERVLIPRPETELLVDLVLTNARPGGVAIDVGTGSGAIAIALAMEGKFSRVVATDISEDALDVARGNAQRIGASGIEFRAGDLLRPTGDGIGNGAVTAVVANPPYISFSEIAELPTSVRDWEPMIALLSARDGLQATARLVRQAAQRLESSGLLALEVDTRRAVIVAELIASNSHYDNVSVHLDLTGRERFVLARRRNTE
jgi:release factor glutamine methyltransferase